ncbi:nucleolar protein dao-5 [Simochromis diagramma]|uniref:nucleolar protein dao-5 n=1 Tax=Simochromis diagramma TaxID=43689 RepID=UPI001A7EF387|nr:nucleolar protein dao-5 [Simochromis diagramma]
MEDGAKEDPALQKEPKFLSKAGWLKKGYGRLLASYKDRYIQVEKTEIVVYENEDLQNCLERLDLENYDKCHELKSPFTKKQRLILIRSAKSTNKVHDVKFQAQTVEDKEAWIKALSDGINRAKNKIFDEVKIDQSSNLEHVTRTRPKGNRNRRPPTRIHMKEVADVSSDGILRLDLDLEDAVMPNGAHYANVDGSETSKEKQLVSITEEEAQPDPDVSPPKKVIKPPMPPIKEAKPSTAHEDEPQKNDGSEKKVPMPPSKEAKPCASPVEETTEEAKHEKISETSSDASKKAAPPPMPPNKPNSVSNVDALQSKPHSHPPMPPSKEKKPSHSGSETEQQVEGISNEDNEKEDESRKETIETAVETDEAVQLIAKETSPDVKDDKHESHCTEETVSSNTKMVSDCGEQIPTESLRKSPSSHPKFNKKPDECAEPDIQRIESTSAKSNPKEGPDNTASVNSVDSKDALAESEVPSLNDSTTETLTLSPLLYHLSGEKKKQDEKSVDSGQHSDDESEGSGSQDTLVAATAALRGSHSLDVVDASEDSIQISVILRPAQVTTVPQVSSKNIKPIPPLKPSAKGRSASIGNLLSESDVCNQMKESSRGGAVSAGGSSDDVIKLETEVALEMEKTSKLLSKVSQDHGSEEEDVPGDLLAEAMEKLKKADHVLREVKKLKFATNGSKRKSW